MPGSTLQAYILSIHSKNKLIIIDAKQVNSLTIKAGQGLSASIEYNIELILIWQVDQTTKGE